MRGWRVARDVERMFSTDRGNERGIVNIMHNLCEDVVSEGSIAAGEGGSVIGGSIESTNEGRFELRLAVVPRKIEEGLKSTSTQKIRSDGNGDGVSFCSRSSHHLYALPVKGEATCQCTRPEVERLTSILDAALGYVDFSGTVLSEESQPNAAEIHAVWVRYHPRLHRGFTVKHILNGPAVCGPDDAAIVEDVLSCFVRRESVIFPTPFPGVSRVPPSFWYKWMRCLQDDMIAKGWKICSPVISAPNAKFPFPTCTGVVVLDAFRVGLYRWTIA